LALLVLAVVLQCVGGGVVGLVLIALDAWTDCTVSAVPGPWETALLNLVIIGFVVTLGCLAARRPVRELLPLRGISPLLVPPILVTMIGTNIVASEVDNLTRMVLPMPDFVTAIFESLVAGSAAGSFLALVVVAPLTEEFLCRGVMLNTLLRRHSPALAIGFSALLFAALHLNPWQLFMPLLGGVIFGWWCWRTGSLVPGLLGHGVLNGMAFTLSYVPFSLEIPGYSTEFDDVIQHQPLWFDALGLILIACGLLGSRIVLPAKPPRPAPSTPPSPQSPP
jgi:uncharacterized protein